MEHNFQLTIYTPHGKYLSATVDYLSVKSSVSVIGILPNHAPLVSTLEISRMTIKMGNKSFQYAIGGGVINIKKNTEVVLMLDSIERSDEIDLARAKAAKQRAEALLNQKSQEVDVKRAKAALSRALNRISVCENKL